MNRKQFTEGVTVVKYKSFWLCYVIVEYVVRWLSPVFLFIVEQCEMLEVSYHKAPSDSMN
jgi:hypothetical protein